MLLIYNQNILLLRKHGLLCHVTGTSSNVKKKSNILNLIQLYKLKRYEKCLWTNWSRVSFARTE